jgi:hypothetical protein
MAQAQEYVLRVACPPFPSFHARWIDAPPKRKESEFNLRHPVSWEILIWLN